ncbi:MAG: NfeD family protein [Pseudomonadota bacterium]
MSEASIWWLLAGGAVVLELLSNTFYLLMLAIGMVAAALAAHLGASQTVQLIVAAVVGGGAVLAWYLKRSAVRQAAQANPDINLDIGEMVHVAVWNPDGTASVQYRGAHWLVLHRPGVAPQPGEHRVVEVVGSRLVLELIESANGK